MRRSGKRSLVHCSKLEACSQPVRTAPVTPAPAQPVASTGRAPPSAQHRRRTRRTARGRPSKTYTMDEIAKAAGDFMTPETIAAGAARLVRCCRCRAAGGQATAFAAELREWGEDLMPPAALPRCIERRTAPACPPSVRLSEVPDPQAYSRRRPLAHSLCGAERSYFTVMAKSAYTRAYNKIRKDELFSTEMDNVTDAYLDYIKDCSMRFPAPPTVACEVKVNFSGYVPDGFGTADLVMIGGNKLRVIDFKYGKRACRSKLRTTPR